MRSIAFYVVFLTALIAIPVLMSSCKKCEPYSSSSTLAEDQQTFIPNNLGDTLEFIDNKGAAHFMVCNFKQLRNNGFSSYGHNNPCDDSYGSWQYLRADFISDLTFDSGETVSLQILIGGTPNYDATFDGSNCNLIQGRNQFFLRFGSDSAAQWLKGFTELNGFPTIRNFRLINQLNLNGKPFQSINVQSIEKPGSETECPAKKISAIGIDSVYYSPSFGLIRFTTVGGKKYQRVL